MPSRKRPAESAPDGAAAAAKKAGIVQLLEVIATHQMDPGLIEAVENDLTPALLEELRTEHPAAEWSYRSMWLRGLSRRAMNGHPFEDAVGHLAALSDDAGSHVAHLRKEMRVQAVLHHLRAKEMDWKAGKKALDRLFEKAGGKGKGRAGAKEADPQAAKMLGEVLEHAQQKHAKKVAQVLSRHSVDELQTQLNVHLDKVKASRKFEGPAEEVVKLDLDAVASSSGVPEGGDGDDFDEVPIEVEKILGHKVDDDTGKVKYHVQLGGWQGKIEANGSWHYADEPALAGAKKTFDAYDKAKKVKHGQPPRPAPPPDERSDELSAVQIPDVAPGVICARGVCSVAEESAPEACRIDESGAITCEPNADASSERDWEYLWPRALLVGCSVLYGTNFPLGRLMNEALPAAASTSARFVLAGAALFPFLLQLAPSLRGPALRCGCFTALGYVSQSIALVDTPAATVAFLGALTVVVCPSLEATLDGRKLGFSDAPQVWLAAGLALAGVAVLELSDLLAPGAAAGSFAGDAWSVLQAVGFGTSFYLTERMMAKEPSQALPITAVQVFVTAAVAAVWAALDGFAVGPFDGGWLLDEASNPLGFGASSLTLPGLFLDPTARTVAGAAAWTGLMTTAANRVGETTALGRVSSAEASVLLATEPMFAAAFAALLIGEGVSAETAAGGALLVGACLANAQSPEAVRKALGITLEEESAEAGSLQERVAAAVADESSQID